MRQFIITWDSKRNKKAVDQNGFVDIIKVINTNTLPATEADGADVYNGIADPGSILGKPSDVFEAMHMQQAIKEYKTDSSNEGVQVK